MGKKLVLAACVAPFLVLLPGSAEEPHAAPEVTAASAKAVEKGTAWLLDIQNRDGSWG